MEVLGEEAPREGEPHRRRASRESGEHARLDSAGARQPRHRTALQRLRRQVARLLGGDLRGGDVTGADVPADDGWPPGSASAPAPRPPAPAATTDHYLASILAQASDAILSTDRDGHVVSWNAAAERLFGYPTESALGRSLHLVDPDRDGAGLANARAGRLSETAERALRTGQPEQLELVCRRADGSYLDVATSAAPIRDEAGNLLGLSVIARDITEQRRAEDALREANRQKDAFLAVMSHELRTPLTSILGYTDMLIRGMAGPTSPRQGGYLENVRAAGNRLLALVNGLLDYSRLEAGGERLNLQAVDIRQAAARAVERVLPEARTRDIRVEVRTDPALERVTADDEKLQQILGAYLANALKFTPEGGRVWLETTRDPDAPGCVRVGVRDTGRGLSPDQLELVWERFYQVDASLTREQSGVGLGLAIVRHLAALHGARVWAESPGLGRGSTFYLSLPLATASPAASGPGDAP